MNKIDPIDEKVVLDANDPLVQKMIKDLETPSERNEHLKGLKATPTLYGEDAKDILRQTFDVSPEQLEKIKERLAKASPVFVEGCKLEVIPTCYNMISSEEELKWFYDHVIQKPAVNESYSAVFVCRHKKLTDEEKKTLGLTRKESEFLATQTFRRKTFKDALYQDEENNWLFERFLATLKRFNVDKGAYTTALGEPLPEKTLAIIFYVNPCDDIKVMREFVGEYMDVNQAISKAMLGGKTTIDNLQSYQWFGRAETNLKHLKANCKGTKYWMDFDIDVPKWFKEKVMSEYTYANASKFISLKIYESWVAELRKIQNRSCIQDVSYVEGLRAMLNITYGKGNYVIVDTSGGYHILVKTSAIKANPHDFCKAVESLYRLGVTAAGEEPYLDEKGNCKFECIVNDSQIPGIPLPGTYQYGREVKVINKEDFND